jgi:hypothetical protein
MMFSGTSSTSSPQASSRNPVSMGWRMSVRTCTGSPGRAGRSMRTKGRNRSVSSGSMRARQLAPNARHRRLVVPVPRPASVDDGAEPGAVPTRTRMGWAQRLHRLFDIDVRHCTRCGAHLRVLAVITDPRVIAAILAHLETRAARAPPALRH